MPRKPPMAPMYASKSPLAGLMGLRFEGGGLGFGVWGLGVWD